MVVKMLRSMRMMSYGERDGGDGDEMIRSDAQFCLDLKIELKILIWLMFSIGALG
ncbi:unnamed protein product [Arabidopsis halleri]